MKKFYFFFALLFAFLGWTTTATGQSFIPSNAPSVSNGTTTWDSQTYWYTIKNNNSAYLTTAESGLTNGNLNLSVTTLTGTNGAAADADMWCLVGSETDGYKFYNKAKGGDSVLAITFPSTYSTVNNGDQTASMVATSTTFSSNTTPAANDVYCTFSRTAGTSYDNSELFWIKDASGSTSGYYQYLNNRSSMLSLWQYNASSVSWWGHVVSDGGSNFVFAPADDATTLAENFYDAYTAFTTAYALADTIISKQTTGVFTWTGHDGITKALNTYSNYSATYKKTWNAGTQQDIDSLKKATQVLDSVVNALTYTLNIPYNTNTNVLLQNVQHSTDYVKADSTSLAAGSSKNSYTNVITLVPYSTTEQTGKYYLYNEYQKKYVGAVPSKNDVAFSMVDSMITTSSSETNPQNDYNAFTIKPAHSWGQEAIIYIADHSVYDRNALHESNSSIIVRWDPTSEGSHFNITTDVAADTTAINTALTAAYNASNAGLGAKNYKANTNVQKAFNNLTTQGGAALEKAMATVEANSTTVDESKYYTIRSAQDTAYGIYEDYSSDSYAPQSKKIADQTNCTPSYWQFEKATDVTDKDYFFIKAANSGKYMSLTKWASTVSMQENTSQSYLATSGETTQTANIMSAGHYVISTSDYIAYNGVSLRCYSSPTATYNSTDGATSPTITWGSDGTLSVGTGNTSSGAGALQSWNMAGNYYNNWIIEEVTSIPVSVTAAGYATLCLPFAVSVPKGSAVTANTVSSETTNALMLTSVEAGTVIPANTPLILSASEETTANFNIVYNSDDTSSQNENAAENFKGVCTPTTLTTSDYILAKPENHTVGMYKLTDSSDLQLSENKAYLAGTTDDSGATMKEFSFGSTTGIATATDAAANDATETWYNLKGQRVLFPARGIFVNQAGQKVLFK